ncbi:MAG: homocysteine S-methyltransferase family protein [Chloroflexota bacterium]|nr:homocysteine S-methyltransferase family protein [Chloroflexota bacterium]
MTQRSPAYEAVMGRLVDGGYAVLDGGIGTEVARRGGTLGAWAALANVEMPDTVRAIHADFITAGADIISANTFACSELHLAAHGIHGREEELNRTAVALALEARERAGAERPLLLAGCMTTTSYRGPEGRVAPAEEDWALASQARTLADAGVDFLMVEMLSHVGRANVELAAAATAGLPVWAGFSCISDGEGNLTLMNQPDESLGESLRRIDLSGVDVAFIMHTRLPEVEPSLAVLHRVWDGPLGAYPHGGTYTRPSWEFDDDFTPDVLAAGAEQWLADGCCIVGGCCGATPAHIAALRGVVDAAAAGDKF